MPRRRPRRHPELNRLYAVVALGVVIWFIFRAYRILSAQVEVGIDAPSRWGLLALGLANALAIASLLFIVARILAKLYFERRHGILGARIRSRLVLALFVVGIAPSLMLFLVGRDFISKNLVRWFHPETQKIIQDGNRMAEAYLRQQERRLAEGMTDVSLASDRDLHVLQRHAGLDLLARTQDRAASLSPGLVQPAWPSLEESVVTRVDTSAGLWLLLASKRGVGGSSYVGGVLVPIDLLGASSRLARAQTESTQILTGTERQNLEALPQGTFLLLTMLTLFGAVWVGLVISRTISEPVRALAKAAQRVGKGDLDVKLPEEGEDELALLSRSFNTMTRDLLAGREAIEAQAARIEGHRAYLGQLLEALPVGVLSWQKDGELRTFNPAARAWLGLEAWDPLTSPWRDLACQPRMGGLPAALEEVRRSRRPQEQELRIGGEGDGRPVRAIVVPLQGGGELAVLEDLSLLAQAEKRAAWQEVARRMAHEVKNPLTPIKLTAQRLLRRIQEGRLDPTVVQEGAETVLTEVESLSRLVDNFSRFAKLPAPQPCAVDACELMRQVHTLYAQGHAGITWNLDIPEIPVLARWDPDMVKRALFNLVDNALGALGHHGHIRLAVMVEGPRVCLEVEDDGPGIPEGTRDKLFEPYFSTKRKGTGLGLAIVRRIAQDHGGEVHYTALSKGSRFVLNLPALGSETERSGRL